MSFLFRYGMYEPCETGRIPQFCRVTVILRLLTCLADDPGNIGICYLAFAAASFTVFQGIFNAARIVLVDTQPDCGDSDVQLVRNIFVRMVPGLQQEDFCTDESTCPYISLTENLFQSCFIFF